MRKTMGYIRNCITSTTERLLLLSVMCLMAQHIQAQGSLDDARYNRFTLMHDGTGNVNTADYGIGYNSYSNDVVATNLMNFRTSFKTRLTLEEPKVEMIDSALCKRAVEEAINIAEHKLDLAWIAEKNRINKRLEIYHDRVQRIGDYNGTMEAYTYFDLNEKKFLAGLQALQDSYQPNSYKKREYTAIYEDLLDADAALCRYLEYCRAKDRIEMPDTMNIPRPTLHGIAAAAHQRWKSVINR